MAVAGFTNPLKAYGHHCTSSRKYSHGFGQKWRELPNSHFMGKTMHRFLRYSMFRQTHKSIGVLLLSLLRFFIFQQRKCDIFAEGVYPNLRSKHLSKSEKGIRKSFDCCTLSNKDWKLMFSCELYPLQLATALALIQLKFNCICAQSSCP